MKFAFALLQLFMILALSPGAEAKVYSESEYAFPLKDPYWATIASALNGARGEYRTHRIEMLPERRNVPLLENRHRVPINVFAQNSYAPMVFIVSGLGGTAFSGTSLLIAEFFHQNGFHAVALPNPMSWHYALGASKSGAPGYLPVDAREFYDFLKEVDRRLKSELKLKISGYSVLGSSYGALLAAFLKDLDQDLRAFNFDRTLLLNPAIDLRHGIKTLDEFFLIGERMSPADRQYVNALVTNAALELFKLPEMTDQEIRIGIQNLLPLTENEKKWLIGNSFRSSLAEIVFVSQQIQDQGILKSTASTFRRNSRNEEAKRVSFSEYMTKITVPRNALNEPMDTLLSSASLYGVLARIGSNPTVYMQGSVDDFLLKTGDVEFLTRQLEDRLYLYPHGGHVGNLRSPINQRDMKEIFALP